MIDTHSHLLPAVDHGSPDMEASVQMARAAAESGVTTVICTPHLQDYDPSAVCRVREAAQALRAALVEAGVALELRTGFEVDLSVAVACEPAELQELTVEGTNGVIVLEMPYDGWPPFLEQTLFRLATGGLKPVLAHPERNDRVQASPEVLRSSLKAGAVAQATAASLTGEFGRAPRRAFETMLQQGMVGLLASDAHAYRTDGWTLTSTLESLRGSMGQEELRALVEENPRRLLQGQALLKIHAQMSGGSRRRGLLRRNGR